MTYTGDVSVGGAPDTRELPGLTITKVAVGSYNNNAYFLQCSATGDVLLIDAAAEPQRLLEVLGDRRLSRIVTTHRHQDHWQGLAAVRDATGAPVAAHPLDADALPVPVTERVEHGGTLRVGDASLSVTHLRGHTPGSIALCYDAGGELAETPHLFTGDSLFPGGVGNTWGDPEMFQSLYADVVAQGPR